MKYSFPVSAYVSQINRMLYKDMVGESASEVTQKALIELRQVYKTGDIRITVDEDAAVLKVGV